MVAKVVQKVSIGTNLVTGLTVWVWFIFSLSKPKERNTDRTIRELERRNEELIRKLEQRGR